MGRAARSEIRADKLKQGLITKTPMGRVAEPPMTIAEHIVGIGLYITELEEENAELLKVCQEALYSLNEAQLYLEVREHLSNIILKVQRKTR
jgi:hypothetical protein